MMHFRELTDRYSLDKILRSTRTGSVLRAIDSRSGQAVAVKLINVASPAELVLRAPQLEKLAAGLEALRHPNLPLLIDSGFTTEGSAFLVMELLEGRTLDAAAEPPLRMLALLYQVLNGLEALARRGLAHHNLSPDNLLLVPGPAPEPTSGSAAGSPAERVKILGLGTAIFRSTPPAAPETACFSAPELTEPAPGEKADWRADLFSFACTTCQVLGAAIEPSDPPVVQLPFALSLELENSEALRQTLERALRRNPAERPVHQALRDAFRLALGAAPEAPAPGEEKPATGPRLVIPVSPPTGSHPVPVASAPRMASSPPPRPTPVPFPPPAAPAATASGELILPPRAAPQTTPPRLAPSAPPAAAAAPDETGGELLSSIDDELLNSLAPASVSSAPPPGPAAGGSAATVVPFVRRPTAGAQGGIAASVAPEPQSPLLRPIYLIAAAAGLVLVVGILYWWFNRGASTPSQPAAQAPAAPPPAPRRPAADVLAEAQLAFADGDDDRTLEILRSLTAADQSTLAPAGCRALQSLADTLQLSALDRLPENLAKGLKGDVGRLRVAVLTAAGQEAAVPEPLRADFARARSLVDLYGQIGAAADRKAHAEVLDRFAAFSQQLPNASDPGDLRDHAATTLEDEAEALARDGKYQEAVNRLDPLVRTWPTRTGLKARIDGYQKAQKDEAYQAQLLAEVPAMERRLPDEVLDKLNAVTPTPHLAARFAEAKKRLEDQLAQIDGQPPEVVLRDGFLLDYDRGRVVTLSFRVTDDYRVRSVKLMARPEGGRMRELPLVANRAFYTVEMPPSFHQNGTVYFYVVATDVSGHTGTFGTPDHPQQIKRREGFRRILR